MPLSSTTPLGLAERAKQQLQERWPSLHADLGRLRSGPRRHRPEHIVRWSNTRRFRAYSDEYGVERGRLRHRWRSLRPRAVLLLTVPSTARVDPNAVDDDRLRWTPAGPWKVLTAAELPADEVVGFGNLLTCQAALLGLAAEDLRVSEPDVLDSAYPLLPCVSVVTS